MTCRIPRSMARVTPTVQSGQVAEQHEQLRLVEERSRSPDADVARDAANVVGTRGGGAVGGAPQPDDEGMHGYRPLASGSAS